MGTRKHRISENPRGLRVFSLSIASVLVFAHLLFWWIEGGEVIWALLFSLLTWGLLSWSTTRLRGVEFDGETLFLSNGSLCTEVPLDAVLDIVVSSSRSRNVSLSYRNSRGTVRKIWFRPAMAEDFSADSMDSFGPERLHPVLAELLESWRSRLS